MIMADIAVDAAPRTNNAGSLKETVMTTQIVLAACNVRLTVVRYQKAFTLVPPAVNSRPENLY